jgi:hypothetical protein
MSLETLLAVADADSPVEFSYFEQYAAILESDEDIPIEDFFAFFSVARPSSLSELTESYFEELLEALPDDQTELYTLVSNIGRNLAGIASVGIAGENKNPDGNNNAQRSRNAQADSGDGADPDADDDQIPDTDDDAIRLFTEEFFKFRLWYKQDSATHCTPVKGGGTTTLPVFDAMVLHRLEKLGNEDYYYDFTDCLDYPLEEYILPVSALVDEIY